MEIYTIGFARRSAESFFEALKSAGVDLLIDVRLNNTSQLAGFTKKQDLPYLLREICRAQYIHELSLAPTQDMLKSYKNREISWNEYERRYLALIADRQVDQQLSTELFATKTVLLCSEARAEHCHRRLVVQYLASTWRDVTGIHL
jgi:uncharacterized protein (DUF488 family)